MNWLARMDVDAEIAYAEHIFDSYQWHKKLWGCFPNGSDKKRDFLTRIDPLEGSFRLWIQAQRKPERPHWCPEAGFALKEITPGFLSHRYYAFDLRANPVKALVQHDESGEALRKPNGKRKRGKRVPLVNQDELRAWLSRKGAVRCRDHTTGEDIPGGFQIIEQKPLEISPMIESHFRKKKQKAFHGGVQFRGALEVIDQQHFAETYQSGIGSAKSFGFGLFLLAPIYL
ncbi:MAG: type I-E CRISPR-associated protein Cas6/Cse3/CasE [Sedimenticola sp.]